MCNDRKGMKNVALQTMKVVLPMLLGGAILYWMYRGEDLHSMWEMMTTEMDWTWMWLSFPFGILAQAFRGWRWRQTLEPIGEAPRTSVSVNSIFLSYAVSLVVPRIGEFTRCAVLKRYDGISFTKALGTVVVERAVDTIIIMIITGLTLILQMNVFGIFFDQTGFNLGDTLGRFTQMGYIVTGVCGIAALLMLYVFRRHLVIYDKVKSSVDGIWQGVKSLRQVRNVPLFLFYSVAIWGSYFLHYYLTFFCFDFTAHLGVTCALVTFIVGSIAVIVPTPNGAGPWHFAVKTMLVLYGVAEPKALCFVLIVHTVQTLLVALLGIYASLVLSFTKRNAKVEA